VERWEPDRSPTGPVSIVVSRGSQRMVVYRNGIEIGRARLEIRSPEPFKSHTLVLTEGPSSKPDPYVPDPSKYRWVLLAAPGSPDQPGTELSAAAISKFRLPDEFVRQVNSILTPGATVFVTNGELTPESSGKSLQVLDANPPEGEQSS
jgi:hypothetical protein